MIWEYTRQIFWSSGIDLPPDDVFSELIDKIVMEAVELPAGEKCILSLQLPAQFLIVFEPVTHAAQFTDLKGSTELYDRVGDLVAYDLVKAHFRILQEAVAAEAGAVVKTIGDAVMATFPTPDRALAAALRMRDAVGELNAGRPREDIALKIGIHGQNPCTRY